MSGADATADTAVETGSDGRWPNQVPATCQSDVYAQLGGPDSGSMAAACDGGSAPRDVATTSNN